MTRQKKTPSKKRACRASLPMDAKGRFTLPEAVRADETGTLVKSFTIIADPELPLLLLVPEENVPRLLEEFRKAHATFLSTSRTPDSQSRLVIPPKMRAHAGLEGKKKIEFLGMPGYCEIWSTANLNKEWDRLPALLEAMNRSTLKKENESDIPPVQDPNP